MADVRTSLYISFAEKYFTTFIQFVSAVLIARLLTPEQIGIFSVAVVIIGFAHMVRDFGVSNFIVQEKHLDTYKIRAAFTVTMLIAWTVALVLLAISPLLASFFEKGALIQLVAVLSLNFWLIPFSSVIFGLLRRSLNFKALFWINTLSTLASSTTGVLMAYFDYGFMSLAWGTVAGSTVTVIACASFKPSTATYKPGLKGIKKVLSFGTKSSVASMAVEVGQNSPDLVIGKLIGFESVGFFSRAMGLATLFNKLIMSAVQSVALPFFADINRSTNKLDSAVAKSINYLLCLAWPFYGFMAIYAEEIILVLYGDQWGESVIITQILCLVFCIRIVPSISSWILIAVGKVGRNMTGRLVWELSALLFIIPAAFVGLNWVAFGLVLSNIIGLILFVYFLIDQKVISLNTLTKVVSRNFVLSFTLLASTFFIKILLDSFITTDFIVLLLGGCIFCFNFLILLFTFSHPLDHEIRGRLVSIFQSKVSRL